MSAIHFKDYTLTLWGFSLPPPVYICWGILFLMLYTGKAPKPRNARRSSDDESVFYDRYDQPLGFWAICFLMSLIAFMATVATNPSYFNWLLR